MLLCRHCRLSICTKEHFFSHPTPLGFKEKEAEDSQYELTFLETVYVDAEYMNLHVHFQHHYFLFRFEL
jgi:hypothetical protein